MHKIYFDGGSVKNIRVLFFCAMREKELHFRFEKRNKKDCILKIVLVNLWLIGYKTTNEISKREKILVENSKNRHFLINCAPKCHIMSQKQKNFVCRVFSPYKAFI
jgi:hypothetical protein